MITEATNYYAVISQLPEDTEVTFHGATWEEYEELLDQVGETRPGLRISYNDGTLKVVSVSSSHEKYACFVGSLVSHISLRLRINIRFSGSATMRKEEKGIEPDDGFHVQTAPVVGNRLDLDFAVDPPPDVVVEVDIHHDSTGNDPIYAALGVPEIWRYDGWKATILHLQGSGYVEAESSNALPMISSVILTDYLARMRQDGEFEAILAFDEWLQSLPR